MELIEVQCACGQVLRVPRWRCGQKGKCNNCQQAVVIPVIMPPMLEFIAPGVAASIIHCPACGQANAPSRGQCTQCGNNLPVTKTRKFPTLLVLLAISIPIGIGGGLLIREQYPELFGRPKEILSDNHSEKQPTVENPKATLPDPKDPKATQPDPKKNLPDTTAKTPDPQNTTVAKPVIPEVTKPKQESSAVAVQKSLEQLENLLQQPIITKHADTGIKARVTKTKEFMGKLRAYKTDLEKIAKQIALWKSKGKNIAAWMAQAQKNAIASRLEELQTFKNFAETMVLEVELGGISLNQEASVLEKEIKHNAVKRENMQEILTKVQTVYKIYDAKMQQINKITKELTEAMK